MSMICVTVPNLVIQPPTTQISKTLNPMEMIIRRFAGSFILISLLLAHYHSPYWLWFTAFVGFNLLQSSFTNFCPLEILLKKLGVGGSCCAVKEPANPPIAK